jgi:hypothetical protein
MTEESCWRMFQCNGHLPRCTEQSNFVYSCQLHILLFLCCFKMECKLQGKSAYLSSFKLCCASKLAGILDFLCWIIDCKPKLQQGESAVHPALSLSGVQHLRLMCLLIMDRTSVPFG